MEQDPSTHGVTQSDYSLENDYYFIPAAQVHRIPQVPVEKQEVRQIPNYFKTQQLKIQGASIESLQFLTDGSFLVAGLADGFSKVISPVKGDTQYVLKGEDSSPVTSICANPNKSLIRNALMLTHSEGTLQYWHATSRQLLFSQKYDQMLQVCQISPNGSHYAFAGDQGKIRFGNLSKSETHEVETGHLGNHDNRIFCLKWNQYDENILASGGWDRAIHFWDIRVKTSVKKLFGFYIGGEAIDFRGNQVLLGNNKNQQQLRVYDLKNDKMRLVPWPLSDSSQTNSITGVLGCFYGDADNQIIAYTPKKEVRLFRNQRCISEYVEEGDAKIYCVGHYPGDRRIATGWSDGTIKFLDY